MPSWSSGYNCAFFECFFPKECPWLRVVEGINDAFQISTAHPLAAWLLTIAAHETAADGPVGIAATASTDSAAEGSLVALFEQLEAPLLGYALRLTRERAAAEDLVQEAFLRLHRQAAGSVEQPRPWLYRTVFNLAMNARRKDQRIVATAGTAHPGDAAAVSQSHGASANRPGPVEPIVEPVDEAPRPGEVCERADQLAWLRVLLEALDERTREVVRLKFDEGLDYATIAKRTGLSSGNVGYILHHALKRLAVEAKARGFER